LPILKLVLTGALISNFLTYPVPDAALSDFRMTVELGLKVGTGLLVLVVLIGLVVTSGVFWVPTASGLALGDPADVP